MTILQQDGLRAIEQCPHGEVPAYLRVAATEGAWRFHHTLTDYAPTPLRALDGLAKELGVGKIFVKDESYRFGLNAFKGLGGIYALSRAAAQALGLPEDIAFSELQEPELQERLHKLVFVTTTDGNHGRGVAWAAHRLGCEAHVFLPKGSAQARAQAILDVGAVEATILSLSYDDAVRYAAKQAEEQGWLLIQDTSWPGYEDVPGWIVQGYTTLAREAVEQLAEAGVSFYRRASGPWPGACWRIWPTTTGRTRPSSPWLSRRRSPVSSLRSRPGTGQRTPILRKNRPSWRGSTAVSRV